MSEKKVPLRAEIAENDKWDLRSLYADEKSWKADLALLKELAKKFVGLKGVFSESAERFLDALRLCAKMGEISEALGNYAFLRTAVDEGDCEAQALYGEYSIASSQISADCAFFESEILKIEQKKMDGFLKMADFADFKVYLQKLIHQKEHILSEKEERILSLHSLAAETADKTFGMLTDVDMEFGEVQGEPLTQSSWQVFMESADRAVRREAYQKFYGEFERHKNALASLYAGSVAQDVFYAKARSYGSSLEAALFVDNVPVEVYKNLVSTIRANLKPLHDYYSARKRILEVSELRHYDVYVPLVPDVKKVTSFDEAIGLVRDALSPLGSEYVDALCGGLKSGWCDRYENKGKRSGAFSSGAFRGDPYILLNYKDDSLRDVFTLAHEGGHSMHSFYSARSNPFMQYGYTIFEAEVASTFNEELLFRHLLKSESDEKTRRYLVAARAADILATLYRQTMFAEFELKTHEMVESGEPLTVESLRAVYRSLLEAYFGSEMVFENESDLEGLRIPHFYSAFYVYKYATGISAAIALAERVLEGGKDCRDDYFKFLKSGGSRWPIDSLKVAGVDMSKSEPVENAVKVFADLVKKL